MPQLQIAESHVTLSSASAMHTANSLEIDQSYGFTNVCVLERLSSTILPYERDGSRLGHVRSRGSTECSFPILLLFGTNTGTTTIQFLTYLSGLELTIAHSNMQQNSEII
jgi:hypothetical protein